MIQRGITIATLFLLLFTTLQCTSTVKTSGREAPRELLGLSIGMDREAALRRLKEIAVLESEQRKAGELWRLKNDARFSSLAIGFDRENKVRYITGLVDKEKARERIRFSDIGDLNTARKEIVAPHYRYIWEIPARDNIPDFYVNVYGDNPEFVTIYSLAKKLKAGEVSEEEEGE